MINLLPPQEKEQLKKERQLKLILILEIIFSAFFISFALMLFAIKIQIASKAYNQQILFEQKNKEGSYIKEKERELNSINKKLLDLNHFYKNQTSIIEVMEKISELLPDGVYLNSLSYQKESGQIALSGVAPTIEKLFELKNNLEKGISSEKINFPPSIWLQSSDISFNVKFTIVSKKDEKK